MVGPSLGPGTRRFQPTSPRDLSPCMPHRGTPVDENIENVKQVASPVPDSQIMPCGVGHPVSASIPSKRFSYLVRHQGGDGSADLVVTTLVALRAQ